MMYFFYFFFSSGSVKREGRVPKNKCSIILDQFQMAFNLSLGLENSDLGKFHFVLRVLLILCVLVILPLVILNI